MLGAVQSLNTYYITDVPNLKYDTSSVKKAVIDYKGWDGQISDSQDIAYPDAKIDMYHRDKPFSGLNLTQLLTDK